MKKIVLSGILALSTQAFALVDYSSPVPADAAKSKVAQPQAPRSSSAPSVSSGEKFFSLNGGTEQLKVDFGGKTNKVSLYSLGGHFQTPYNIYLDAAIWGASAQNSNVTDQNKTQIGNSSMKLGFNWLTLGNSSDVATFDFTAGAMFAGPKSSDFASSRTDTMVGVELTKRFSDFALLLGYEYRFTGKTKTTEETPVGNIQKVMASLGWKVSNDIRFALEGMMYRVGPNKLNTPNAGLSGNLNFVSLSPKLSLGLASSVDLELGALYRTRTVALKDDIVGARLWDLKGLYGNSIFANLVLSL